MSLLLVPATIENLEKSIEKSVPLSFAKKYLSASFLNELIRISGIEGIRCWAMTKNSLRVFNQIQKGDEVLLTKKNTGKFTHYGIVIAKIQNQEFGNALWPFVGQAPWEYIYFLANIVKTQIDKRDLVKDLGYADNFAVPGVIMVNEKNYNKIGTISRYCEIPVNDNIAEINLDKDFSSENIQSLGTRRKGHLKFSKTIKENYSHKCTICGISEPEFLIAGHISTWSEDSINRLNPQNGICFCSFHDKAFEHGYIGINEKFQIILNSKINQPSTLYDYLKIWEAKQITLPAKDLPDTELLKKHREKYKLGEYGN